jgi:LmbE family N-acetylglucosaminyl deacetylase
MTSLFLLAHYDDEYCAWPLIETWRRAAEPMVFVYTAPPREPDLRARRRAETLALLGSMGLADALLDEPDPPGCDGELPAAAPAWLERLRARLAQAGVSRIVVPAWEGGHTDHDLCAALGLALAHRLGVAEPVIQVPLYNGERTRGPLFEGGHVLAANGAAERVRLSPIQWLRFAAAVRFFPSQAGVWSTLWPATMWSYLKAGYRFQRLSTVRIGERPHSGPLLYERRGYARFEDVAAVAARLTASDRPARAGAGGRRP